MGFNSSIILFVGLWVRHAVCRLRYATQLIWSSSSNPKELDQKQDTLLRSVFSDVSVSSVPVDCGWNTGLFKEFHLFPAVRVTRGAMGV
jgi:hypothetical protein